MLGSEGAARTYAGLRRPMTEGDVRFVTQVFGWCIAGGGVGGLLAGTIGRLRVRHPTELVVDSGVAVLVGAFLILLGARSGQLLTRHFGWLIYAMFLIPGVMITAGQYGVGPLSDIAALLYVEVPILGYYLLRPVAAVAITCLGAMEFGGLALVQPGYALPGLRFLFLIFSLLLVGFVFGGLVNRAVRESDRHAGLARFLAPQVAEVVLSTGSGLLEPHRRLIAVLFCDLRGFTRFASSAEPEDTVEVLQSYFEAAGAHIQETGATVGGFAGDGIMAYFNDPVPHEDAAGAAVDLAERLRGSLDRLVDRWHHLGFELSYGIGVAYGYATLGVFGFQGRDDYAALGTVVNLAARLSDHAAPREILLDARTHDRLGMAEDLPYRELVLKGFADPVTAFSLSAPAGS